MWTYVFLMKIDIEKLVKDKLEDRYIYSRISLWIVKSTFNVVIFILFCLKK